VARLVSRPAAGAFAALCELVWPVSCGGCGDPVARWCSACSALLTGPALPTAPDPCPAGLPPARATAVYDGAVRQAIVAWKDRGRHDLTGPLSSAVTASVRAGLLAALGAARSASDVDVGPAEIWLVPAPSRGSARRARGADPVRALAVGAAAAVRREGWPVRVVPALRHTRRVADQAGLGSLARAANLAGALEVHPRRRSAAKGSRCLLVDDIVTTGATLAEAAAALRRAGADPFGVAVVAATRRTTHPD
jgi:predicted amidophosphoribosyltransferase